MSLEDFDKLKAKRICWDCVSESYLREQIQIEGKRRRCSYCATTQRTFGIGELAERVTTAFEQHYVRTPDQPNDHQYMLLRDREIAYEWDRDGAPVVQAITEAAEIPDEAAEDVQKILAHAHDDLDSQQMGEETEFGDESYYEPKAQSDATWQEEWRSFETALKTEARFFSRTASQHLDAIFDGLAQLNARDGRPLIRDAGPGTTVNSLYRARVFQSDTKLEEALLRPDKQLGSPPAPLARAGRMNAQGISVFYGASDSKTAIAEARPPVGSRVAVAQFEILRKLRLLDLTALESVHITGSIFDPAHASRLERAQFLRSLSSRITRPVMPDDEPFAYLATQAIADYLATQPSPPLDGIIFPSVQIAGAVLNVVLFHHAALVEKMLIPKGTEISTQLGRYTEDGWEEDYNVIEQVPPSTAEEKPKPDHHDFDFDAFIDDAICPRVTDPRQPTLRIIADSVHVHHVQRVEVETQSYHVQRYRWTKRDPEF